MKTRISLVVLIILGAIAVVQATGTLLFNWQMENSYTADYSAGDTTGSAGGSGSQAFDGTTKHDGSYSWKATNQGYCVFDVSSNDTVKNTGACQFYVYFDAIAAVDYVIDLKFGSDNNNVAVIVTDIAGTKYLYGVYTGNSSSVTAAATANTVVTTGQWYKCTLRWRTGATDPSLSFQVDSNTATTNDTDLTSWTVANGQIVIGNQTTGNTTYFDNFKVWDDWAGPDAAAAGFNAKSLLGVGK